MGAIFSFLIILSVLVLVHELGHFLLARKFNIKVEEFGLGYPPRIWGKKKGETTYSINALLLGGFVRLLGEDYAELKGMPDKERKRAFSVQKKRVRVMVLMAGVVMNFLLGIVLFAAIYTKIGIPEKVDYLIVTGLAKDSPAEKAGIQLEDKIVGVEGMEWPNKENLVTDFVDYVKDHRGEEVKLLFQEKDSLVVIPRLEEDTPEGQGSLGVGITSMDLVQYPLWQRPFRGMVVGIKEALAWGKEIVVGLGKMFYKLFKGDIPKDVAGPVGIYEISKNVVEEGIMATLQFMAILSINLSILNLLPIPALDGGRLLFIAIESVIRKRVKPEIEQTIHIMGMVLILGLMLLITINDIRRLLG